MKKSRLLGAAALSLMAAVPVAPAHASFWDGKGPERCMLDRTLGHDNPFRNFMPCFIPIFG